MRKYRIFSNLFILPLLLGLTLVGCDLFGGASEGRIRVLLTDAPFPFDLVDSTNVTIERVELWSEDEDVLVLADTSMPFNLLDLRDGVTAELASVGIPEGTYTQIRVVVGEDAAVVMNDGTVYDLKLPSGSTSGLKIPLPALDVDGDDIEVTLDFNVEESFVVRGNPMTLEGISGFLFKPVIKPIYLEVDGDEIDLGDEEEADGTNSGDDPDDGEEGTV